MRNSSLLWKTIGLSLIVFLMLSCTFLSPLAGGKALPTQTPTPTALSGAASGNTGGSAGSGSGSSSGGGSGSGSGNGTGQSGDAGATEIPTEPAITPQAAGGPWVVKQVITLGHESISGQVCSLTQPFSVNSSTPKVAFVFVFTPTSANQGTVAYAYNIPSAGESHDAKGKYTLSRPDKTGEIVLNMQVSDHVVFKGFDGNIPNRYYFDLVPSNTTTCPPA